MSNLHFPGRPTDILTMQVFMKRLEGRHTGSPVGQFHEHVVELMRLHSGTANKFVSKHFNITYVRYRQIIQACDLSLARADVFKEVLNVDMSVFMTGRYPPLSRSSAA